jgi:hypothetical protein
MPGVKKEPLKSCRWERSPSRSKGMPRTDAQGGTRTEHRAWHDLSNAPGEQDVPQARIYRRVRPSRKSAGLPSPMFPPTSLAAGVAAAHRPPKKAQRTEAQVKRCGEEDRHLRSSSLRLHFSKGTARALAVR